MYRKGTLREKEGAGKGLKGKIPEREEMRKSERDAQVGSGRCWRE